MNNSVDTDLPSASQTSDILAEVALNLRWSWNHAADQLWERLDPELWDLTHNPWFVLQTVPREKLRSVTSDPGFQKLAQEIVRKNRAAVRPAAWFQKAHPNTTLKGITYFSMEFMLSEALPIYSGGLGNVAGDQLKAASNLGGRADRCRPGSEAYAAWRPTGGFGQCLRLCRQCPGHPTRKRLHSTGGPL
jgi:starch phosphorylase